MTTGGRILVPIAEPILTNAGAPDVGATMLINIAGGSVKASLFADAALSTPIANPQTANAAGRFYAESTEWWADDSQAYDVVITPTSGGTLTFDNVYTLGPATNVSGFAPINSPTFTGVPQAPTPATNDNSPKIATTAYVQAQGFATLNSPALTGTPTAPTAAALTSTTQIATTAFVTSAIGLTSPTSTTSGYLKIGGFILQWTPYSLGASTGSSQAITWPIAFPTAIIIQPWAAEKTVPPGYMVSASSVTTTGCTVNKSVIDGVARTGVMYALGY